MKQNNAYSKRSAILITHGTDTLAWTHAAVRYAVKTLLLILPSLAARFLCRMAWVHHIFTVYNTGQTANSDSPMI